MTRSFTFTTVRSELPKATFSKAGKAGLLKREGDLKTGLSDTPIFTISS